MMTIRPPLAAPLATRCSVVAAAWAVSCGGECWLTVLTRDCGENRKALLARIKNAQRKT